MDSVSFQPDMHSPVAIGASAFNLAFSDLLGQGQILCRDLHPFDISIVAATWDAEEPAHLTDTVLLPVMVDHLIFNAGFHSFPISERKSRNNSFSIFNRLISYACSATMSLGSAFFLGRPWGRSTIPATFFLPCGVLDLTAASQHIYLLGQILLQFLSAFCLLPTALL